MKEDCELNKDCFVLIENRIYINEDSSIIRKLHKVVSLDKETKILNKISNTPNKELQLNKGEKYKINFSNLVFIKIENCKKTDVGCPSIFPDELNENSKYDFIEPGRY